MAKRILLVADGAAVLDDPTTEVIATYESGEVLIRTDARSAEAARGQEQPVHGLVLDGIDERRIAAAEATPLPEADVEMLAYVELAGPVESGWLDKIKDQGIELLRFQPRTAYLSRGTPAAFDAARELAFVVRIVPLVSDLKARPRLAEAGDEPVWIVVEGSAGPRALADRLQAIQGVRIDGATDAAAGIARIPAHATNDALSDILAVPLVLAVEPRQPVIPEDEIAGLILAGAYDSGGRPSGDYRQWLADQALTGRGVTIGIVDNGVDETHEAFSGRITARDNGRAWHGTFVAGHAAGRYLAETDGDGFIYGLGTAPSAEIISQDNSDTASASCQETATTAGPSGATGTIQNNSWGVGTHDPMDYRSLEASYDALVRNATPGDATVRPLTVCFSAGNSGSSGLTRPKAAKNVIVTGNSENYRPDVGGSESDNIHHLFTGTHGSSHGNCGDGRIRPHVTAPGEWTASANYDSLPGQAEYISDKLTWGGGTSGASPKTAGACALLTQWWRDRNGGATPSPALLRAMIVNGAEDMGFGGPIPNSRQGWGRLNLANVLSDDVHHTYVDQSVTLRHRGEARTWRLRVTDPDMPVRVTLTWTDPPGPLNSGTATVPAVVNKLALSVESNGRTYNANKFTNGFSVDGPLPDPDKLGWDNLQNVYLAPGDAVSPFTVRVSALDITTNCLTGTPTDPQQDFALVITNGFADAGFTPADLFLVVDDTGPGTGSSVDDVVGGGSGSGDDDLFGSRPTLRRGDRGKDVEDLQWMLMQLGHLEGPADGIFGWGTRRAVVDFQQAQDLSADGVVGPSTWAALDAATAGGGAGPTNPTQPTLTPTPTTTPTEPPVTNRPTLRIGDRGEDVRVLQQALADQGFLSGNVGGIFGNGTMRAVKSFQMSVGLTADGVVGPGTWTALLGEAPSGGGASDPFDDWWNAPWEAQREETVRRGTVGAETVERLAEVARRGLEAGPADARLEEPRAGETGGYPPLSEALKRLMERFDAWVADGRLKAAVIVVGSGTRVTEDDLRALRRLAVHGELYVIATDAGVLKGLVQALHMKRGIHPRVATPETLDEVVRAAAAEATGGQQVALLKAEREHGAGRRDLRLAFDLTDEDSRASIEVVGVGTPSVRVVPPGGDGIALTPSTRRKGFRLSIEDARLTLELVRVDGRPWAGRWEALIEDRDGTGPLRPVGVAGPGPAVRVIDRPTAAAEAGEADTRMVSVQGEHGAGITRVTVERTPEPGVRAFERARPIAVEAKQRRLDQVGAERVRSEAGEVTAVPTLDAIVPLPEAGGGPALADLCLSVEGMTAAGQRFHRILHHCPVRLVPRRLWRARRRGRVHLVRGTVADVSFDRAGTVTGFTLSDGRGRRRPVRVEDRTLGAALGRIGLETGEYHFAVSGDRVLRVIKLF